MTIGNWSKNFKKALHFPGLQLEINELLYGKYHKSTNFTGLQCMGRLQQ